MWIPVAILFGSLATAVAQASTCEIILESCPGGLGSDSCAQQYCQYDCSPTCCALSSMAEIHNCFAYGVGGGGRSSTTTKLNYPSSIPECATIISIYAACSALTPGFTALSPASQIPCLCYDTSGNYFPDIWNNAAAGCYSWALQSDLAEATQLSLGGAVEQCTSMTNGASGGGSGAIPITTLTGGGGVGGGTITINKGVASATSSSFASPGSDMKLRKEGIVNALLCYVLAFAAGVFWLLG